MAGYSGKSLEEKLGIKPGMRMWLQGEMEGTYEFIHLFSKEKDELEKLMTKALDHLQKDGMLWVSWPKKVSQVKTDLDENVIRGMGLKLGVVDVKVAAVDETWSALKFVYRLKDREPKQTAGKSK